MSITTNIDKVKETQVSIEKQLVLGAQQNIQAFEKLYNKHYEQIFRYVYQRVNEKEDAFDITSQVFIKAMINIKNFKFKGFPFSSWLYRIAKSEVYQFFRDNQKSPEINVQTEQLAQIAEEAGENGEEKPTNQQVIDFLATLSDEELPYIEMRFLENRSFKEIAHILEITENNAKVKTHRILKKMKKKFLIK